MVKLAVICISLLAGPAIGQGGPGQRQQPAAEKSARTTAVTFDLMGFAPGMSRTQVEGVVTATLISPHGDWIVSALTNPSSLEDWCFERTAAVKGWSKVGLAYCHVYRMLPGDFYESLSFIFVDDKLASTLWKFPHSQFHDVSAALTKKYANRAQPLYTQSAVQNRMGATYSNHTLTWRSTLSTAQLEEYSGDLDTSAVRVEDRSLVKEFDKRVPSRLPAL
jgi:hypothetical protein